MSNCNVSSSPESATQAPTAPEDVGTDFKALLYTGHYDPASIAFGDRIHSPEYGVLLRTGIVDQLNTDNVASLISIDPQNYTSTLTDRFEDLQRITAVTAAMPLLGNRALDHLIDLSNGGHINWQLGEEPPENPTRKQMFTSYMDRIDRTTGVGYSAIFLCAAGAVNHALQAAERGDENAVFVKEGRLPRVIQNSANLAIRPAATHDSQEQKIFNKLVKPTGIDRYPYHRGSAIIRGDLGIPPEEFAIKGVYGDERIVFADMPFSRYVPANSPAASLQTPPKSGQKMRPDTSTQRCPYVRTKNTDPTQIKEKGMVNMIPVWRQAAAVVTLIMTGGYGDKDLEEIRRLLPVLERMPPGIE
jgi:hypothetical protein